MLFEVQYQPVDFVVLAGETAARTSVIAQPSVRTGFEQAMLDNNVSADDIDLIGGFRARVTSLTGEDFSEIERIELRACPVGTVGGCIDITSRVFGQGDLFGRRRQTVDLSPSSLNFRELFLGNEAVRIELTFRAGITTQRNVEARLEWSMAAFAEVD